MSSLSPVIELEHREPYAVDAGDFIAIPLDVCDQHVLSCFVCDLGFCELEFVVNAPACVKRFAIHKRCANSISAPVRIR